MNKQQVLGMMESGFLVITSCDRLSSPLFTFHRRRVADFGREGWLVEARPLNTCSVIAISLINPAGGILNNYFH